MAKIQKMARKSKCCPKIKILPENQKMSKSGKPHSQSSSCSPPLWQGRVSELKEILSSFSQEKCPSAKQQNKTTKARAKQRRQYPSSFCTTNNCSKKTPAKSIIFVWRKATFFIFYLNDFLSPPVLSLSAEPFPPLHSPGYLLMIEYS